MKSVGAFKTQINVLGIALNLLPKPPSSPLIIFSSSMKPKAKPKTKPLSSSPCSRITSQSQRIGVIDSKAARIVSVGAISVGLVWLMMMGMDDDRHNNAMALEGPVMEEFWENIRRYALYALTVSTGALYTIFQPIAELLKNPVSAILLLLIFAATIYILSQVLYAMVGLSD